MNYKDFRILLNYEIIQRQEEGYNLERLRKILKDRENGYLSKFQKIINEITHLQQRTDYPYIEPSIISKIRNERSEFTGEMSLDLSKKELFDKIYGGWLGRCAGCLLGKPAEGLHKENIEDWLKKANNYPLSDYFPTISQLTGNIPDWLGKRASQREILKGTINCMKRDDDIDYTIINLHLLKTKGMNFSTADLGNLWLSNLPYQKVYTAERVAYRNLINGIVPPRTATYMNPYREWIGAQIRADIFGYVTPGMPRLAAEISYKDAVLSHIKNGIYGEMFVSAMISSAFCTCDIEEIIKAGLSEIPLKSRLAEAIRNVVNWSKEYSDWVDTWKKIMEYYGYYNPVHTINNASMVLLGLLYGKGDFQKTITISVMGGLDTDCNGATSGSILGVLIGASELPKKWIEPMNDIVESYVPIYNSSKISDLARITLGQSEEVRAKPRRFQKYTQ